MINFPALRQYIVYYTNLKKTQLPPGTAPEDFGKAFDLLEGLMTKNRDTIPPRVWAAAMLALGGQLKKEKKWPDETSETSQTKS